MDTQKFDYAIIGGGLAGLQLAKAFIEDDHFKNKCIAVIEPSLKTENDKTWSFWEEGVGQWDHLVSQSWKKGKVFGRRSEIDFNLSPYHYKSIRSIDFYNSILQQINTSGNCTFIQDEVVSVSEENRLSISGKKNTYWANQVFDSRIPSGFKSHTKATKLLQHFKGWVIETPKPTFNPEVFTMMDYRLVYKNTTSFTYILPISETKALVEYTFFSPELVDEPVYDEQLNTYISEVLEVSDYKVTETEQGIIPMTDYKFQKHNTEKVTKIGTAGGWVKGSSGYSFKHTEKNVAQILSNLKRNKPITKGIYSQKHQFYDAIFLKVLFDNNAFGPKLFENFYSKNTISDCFQFLDNASSFYQDLKIIWSLKSMRFVNAFFKSL